MIDPRNYAEWRQDEHDRKEDAAYSLAYHVIKHCRDEVIEKEIEGKSLETQKIIEACVDHSLSSFFDLAEGFFKLHSGTNQLELVLRVRVLDEELNTLEELDISPKTLDLPIGYWKWAHEKNFRSAK